MKEAGGLVIQVDTGMLAGDYYPGGRASVLEIQGNTLTAIYRGRPRERVVAAVSLATGAPA